MISPPCIIARKVNNRRADSFVTLQWAEETSWYPQITQRSFNYSVPMGERVEVVPARTVLEVCCMLCQLLRVPLEVVSKILDFSEYWEHSFTLQKEHLQVSRGYTTGGTATPDLRGVAYLSVKLDDSEVSEPPASVSGIDILLLTLN